MEITVRRTTPKRLISKREWNQYRLYEDNSSLDWIVRTYLPFLQEIVDGFYDSHPYSRDIVDRDMVWDFGIDGLISSINHYKYTEKTKFRGFAYKRVWGSIIDGIRRWTKKGKNNKLNRPDSKTIDSIKDSPIDFGIRRWTKKGKNTRVKKSGRDVLYYERDFPPLNLVGDRIKEAEFFESLDKKMLEEGLSRKEVNMVRMKYIGLSFKEIGRAYGVTQSAISFKFADRIKPSLLKILQQDGEF